MPEDEPRLVHRMIELATRDGRDGYRRVTGLLRGAGWPVNHKRGERLWRRDGLKVPQTQPKRGRRWLADGSCVRRRPEYRHHVWASDFVAERTHDSRPLKILTVVDEYSRACLAIVVARRLRSTAVLETLADLFMTYDIPAHIRSDNGSEFTAELVRLWLEASTSTRCSSNRVARGRTAPSNRSTASCGTNGWTARSFTRCRKPRS